AGTISVGPIQTMTVEDFRDAMDVMFWGMVYTTLEALPHFQRNQHGRIVNITSIGGKISVPHLVPYSCAKFAAVAFSEGIRAELSEQRIQVTTIAPGLMRTGGRRAEITNEANNRLIINRNPTVEHSNYLDFAPKSVFSDS